MINDGRSPGKTHSLGGDSRERKSRATEGHKSTRKETLVWLPFFVAFRDFLWPFPSCPSRAQGSMLSSRESPRSGVNVVGLRPSLIAQHSLRGFFSSIHAQGEGGFSVINDGRSPGKTPSLPGDSRGRNEIHSHKKHKSARKSNLARHSIWWFFVTFRGNSRLPVTAGGCRMTP